MLKQTNQTPREIVPSVVLLAGGAALFMLGVLLIANGPEARWAVGAILIGFSVEIVAYSWWLLLHPKMDWRNPLDFLKALWKTILLALALLGVASVFQGVGALAGWDSFSAVGATLGKAVRWILTARA